jgi:hypothetical protein
VSAQQTDNTFTVKGVSFVMKPVAGGTFQMGYNLAYDECPVHSVTLSSYYIGKTEVTQALWEAVMGSNPSSFKGNNLPVEQVSWEDCQTFITKLNQLTGQKFRLPTEAEWEYAARGGKNSKGYEYSGSNKLGDVAWYNSKKTHPVATKQPNELGIYDMTGNVDEWCQDWYDDSYYRNSPSKDPSGPTSGTHRVYRGHNWYSTAKRCRVSSLDRHDPSGGNYFMGFRLAMSSNSSASTATQKATTASTSTPKTTMTASAGTQVRYHDVEYHEAKGKVKSITYPPGPDETEASIGEFTIDGKEKGPTGAEYDSNGYCVSRKSRKYFWVNGRMVKAITSDRNPPYIVNNKYNAKGELIEMSMGSVKPNAIQIQFSDYKYDAKGNWISRKRSSVGVQSTETRTIEYY